MPITSVPRHQWVLCALMLCAMPCAHGTVTSTFGGGTLTVTSNGSDAIAVSCTGVGGNVVVNGAAPGTGAVACAAVTQLTVTGGPGANAIDLTGVAPASYTALATRTVDGAAGADTIAGSPGADILLGGTEGDSVDGNQGSDTVFLGDGDDNFAWQPGDGSDVVEGQGGTDRLQFNGSAGSENITISPNGQRLIFFRDVASVTIDGNGLERIEYDALGGADHIVVNSLATTDVTQVALRLSSLLGGNVGDAQVDQVSIFGGGGVDSIGADAIAGTIVVTNGLTTITTTTMEPANDNLLLDGGDGSDTLVVGSGLAGQIATLSVAGGLGADTVVARGSAGIEQLAASASPPFVSSAGVALIDVLTTENLRLEGLGNGDTLSASGNIAALFAMIFDGGDGGDTLLGSNGADILFGGPGLDTIDGNQGADIAFGGDGDDVFQWDPGDGSDVLEGQPGDDVLRFNGSAGNENIALLPNGQRAMLTRDLGAIVMDFDDVEQVDLSVLGGVDNVTVNDLAATDASQVHVFTAGTLGGSAGDAQIDTISLNAGSGADTVAIAAAGGVVSVARATQTLVVVATEPTSDRLVVNGLGGDDSLHVASAAAAAILLTLDGGASSSGSGANGDVVSISGEATAENYAIAQAGARVALTRSAPASFVVDINSFEWLGLAVDAGADTVVTQGLAATGQILDGGAPATVPGDTLNVTGFSGDVFASPIVIAGAAPIVHANFEQSTNQQVIEAFLTGAQETPPNPSSGRGYGTVTLNGAQDAILVFLEYSGLGGNNTALHIHGPAPRRVAAPAIIDLPTSGTTSGTFSVGPIPITPTQRSELQSGRWYFNVHSTAPGSSNGEIRGQLDNVMFRDGFE